MQALFWKPVDDIILMTRVTELDGDNVYLVGVFNELSFPHKVTPRSFVYFLISAFYLFMPNQCFVIFVPE